VLYCALEDTPRRAQSRIRQLGEPGRPEQLEFVFELPRTNDGGLELVRDWLKRHPYARMVVVDVLAKVRPGSGKGDNAYEGDYAAVGEWKALADEHNIAILLIHHVRKMVADDPLEMLSGTNGISGAADTLVVLNRTGDGITLYGRGRDVDEFDKALGFDKQTGRWSLLGETSDVRRSDERRAIIDLLKGSGRPLSPSEIAGELDRDGGAVRQLLLSMARAGEVRKISRGLYVADVGYVPDSGHNNHDDNIGDLVTG
jgi:hypothetical protein